MKSEFTREEVLAEICRCVADLNFALFVGNGYNARCAASLSDDPRHFHMVGSMGLCPVLAAGFSQCSGVPTIAVEGDGNALMGLSGMPLAVQAASGGFVHVVCDNGLYETTGRQATIAPRVDFLSLARGAGYDQAVKAVSLEDIGCAMKHAVERNARHFLCVVTVPHQSDRIWPRVKHHPRSIARRFQKAYSSEPAESVVSRVPHVAR